MEYLSLQCYAKKLLRIEATFEIGLTFIIKNTLNQKLKNYSCDEVTEALSLAMAIVKFTIGIVSVSWSCLPVRAIATARLANAGLRQQMFTVTNARHALAR